MSLTISKSEGVTVFTMTSNHKSKWPLFCQILRTMCYSPVCSVSPRLKQRFSCALTALAIIQIMVGVMNLGYGTLNSTVYFISESLHFGIGGVFIAVGIMCILAEKFPSPCLVVLTVVMNIVSAALAITAIVLYSVDLALRRFWYTCQLPERRRYNHYYWMTTSPTEKAKWADVYEKNLEQYRVCQENLQLLKIIHGGLCIVMIVLSVLQLSVTISWCFLNIKALCKKESDTQDVEDPEVKKPLLEQDVPNPVS